MSHLDARFQTNKATIWRVSDRNRRGAPTYELIGVFGATWKSGGKASVDSDGVKFIPKDTYYVNQSATVGRGDLIARGDVSSGQPTGDVVRATTRYDNSFFGNTDSLIVMTE